MAFKYFSDIVLNVRPSNNKLAEPGQIYFDSSINTVVYFNGLNWIPINQSSQSGANLEGIEYTDTGIKLIYSDGSMKSLTLYFGSHIPDDEEVTTTVGGIKAGTKASVLKTKTTSQLIEDMLFAELNPTLGNNPSISFNTIQTLHYVNDSMPTITASFSRGYASVSGKTFKLAGENGTITYNFTYNNQSIQKPDKVKLGNLSVSASTVTITDGDTILTSKGNTAVKYSNGNSINENPIKSGKTYRTSSNLIINGTYPIYSNGVSSNTDKKHDGILPSTFVLQELPKVKWDSTMKLASFYPEEYEGSKMNLYYPSQLKISKVQWYNTFSGQIDDLSLDNFEEVVVSNELTNCSNLPSGVEYTKLQYIGSDAGERQYIFTLIQRS